VANMSPAMQVKLYRVLQEGKVRPVGGTEEISVDVRVIAATNRVMEREIAEGRFREDLFYRLSVIPVELPPLRERREDIPLLARSFLDRFSKSMGKIISGIAPDAMRCLETYEWPGNVRELENTLERAVALETGSRIGLESLPERIREARPAASPALRAAAGTEGPALPGNGVRLEKLISEMERSYLEAALSRAGGVRVRAAALLGISYRSFRHLAKKHGV
jgi:two-component system, NtrC family, response regulator PilR